MDTLYCFQVSDQLKPSPSKYHSFSSCLKSQADIYTAIGTLSQLNLKGYFKNTSITISLSRVNPLVFISPDDYLYIQYSNSIQRFELNDGTCINTVSLDSLPQLEFVGVVGILNFVYGCFLHVGLKKVVFVDFFGGKDPQICFKLEFNHKITKVSFIQGLEVLWVRLQPHSICLIHTDTQNRLFNQQNHTFITLDNDIKADQIGLAYFSQLSLIALYTIGGSKIYFYSESTSNLMAILSPNNPIYALLPVPKCDEFYCLEENNIVCYDTRCITSPLKEPRTVQFVTEQEFDPKITTLMHFKADVFICSPKNGLSLIYPLPIPFPAREIQQQFQINASVQPTQAHEQGLVIEKLLSRVNVLSKIISPLKIIDVHFQVLNLLVRSMSPQSMYLSKLKCLITNQMVTKKVLTDLITHTKFGKEASPLRTILNEEKMVLLLTEVGISHGLYRNITKQLIADSTNFYPPQTHIVANNVVGYYKATLNTKAKIIPQLFYGKWKQYYQQIHQTHQMTTIEPFRETLNAVSQSIFRINPDKISLTNCIESLKSILYQPSRTTFEATTIFNLCFKIYKYLSQQSNQYQLQSIQRDEVLHFIKFMIQIVESFELRESRLSISKDTLNLLLQAHRFGNSYEVILGIDSFHEILIQNRWRYSDKDWKQLESGFFCCTPENTIHDDAFETV